MRLDLARGKIRAECPCTCNKIRILLGTLDYIRLQRHEYMGDFLFYKFFLTTKNECKEVAFDYSSIPDVSTKGIK